MQFIGAVSNADYTVLKDGMAMNNELERTLKKVAVV
jgi:hypothetical protein